VPGHDEPTLVMTTDREHDAVDAARRRARLDLRQLWLRYVALGGDAGPMELEAYLAGLMPLDDYQHTVLAHAINEALGDLGEPARLAYRRPPEGGHASDLPS
jgi:hypothetical protein